MDDVDTGALGLLLNFVQPRIAPFYSFPVGNLILFAVDFLSDSDLLNFLVHWCLFRLLREEIFVGLASKPPWLFVAPQLVLEGELVLALRTG